MSKIFDIDFRTGSLQDNVSKTFCTNHTVKFKQTDRGLMGYFDGSSYLEIPILSLGTEHSLVITKKAIYNGALVGGALSPQSYFLYEVLNVPASAGFYYSVQDVNPGLQITPAMKGTILQIIVIRNGTSVKMYKNNVLFYDRTLASNPTLTIDRIGSLSDNSNKYTGYIGDVKIFTHALTETERNKHYSNFLNSKPLAKTKSNLYFPKPTSLSNETGLLASYNMQVVNGNQILDTSGNGRHLTATSVTRFSSRKNSVYINDNTWGTSCFAGASNTWQPTGNFTWQYTFRPARVDASVFPIVMTRISALGLQFVILNGYPNFSVIQTAFSDSIIGDSPCLTLLNTATIQIVRTGSLFQMYFNGILQADTITWSGTLLHESSIKIGNGDHQDLRIYNRALSTQEIKDYHNTFAKRVNLKEDFVLEPADGTSIKPKGWIKPTTTFKITELTADDSVLKDLKKGTKQLTAIGAGSIYLPSKQAYGIWEFDFYRGGVGQTVGSAFICKEVIPVANFTGYDIILASDSRIYLRRLTGGGAANLFTTAASYLEANKIHRIKLTRTSSGVFTMYIKGGSFGSEYQLVSVVGGTGTNPVTDNTHGISNIQRYSFDIGCKIGNIKFTEGIEV
jgi:hypothetical protein